MKDAKGHGSDPRGGVSAHSIGVDQVGQPSYLYHATLGSRLAAIQKSGLAAHPENAHWNMNHPTGVYFAQDPQRARYYGRIAAKNWGGGKTSVELLRARVEHVPGAVPVYGDKDRHRPTEAYTTKAIPSEHLEIFRKGKWGALKTYANY